MPPIVVIEDDHQLRQMIQWTLEDEGLEVETAATGREAIALLASRRPALIVLDWGLPESDGSKVADSLRAAHGETVPILLITADGRAADKAERVGARAYLHKPFELIDLIDLVRDGLASA